MDILKQLHGLLLPNIFPVPLIPTPFALVTLVLFLWSFAPAIKGTISRGFTAWTRLTWAFMLLPAATGVILAIGGLKVPSATDSGGGISRYGFAVDPKRDLEHIMYTAFALVSLYAIEILIQSKLSNNKLLLKYLPLITLFLYGVAYMIARVAVFPSNSVR